MLLTLKKISTAFILILLTLSCSPAQKMSVSKVTTDNAAPRTMIYSLPKTRVDIDLQVTKITIQAGPFAAYAEKYLTLKYVPVSNSESYEITSISIKPVSEPDQDYTYGITYSSFPSNLDKIMSLTAQGLMLDPSDAWHEINTSLTNRQEVNFNQEVLEPNIIEKTDTLYKTILTDASFVKVPVYKKTMEVKTDEDRARILAEMILKIRKKRLKILMGDSEYHPDGAGAKIVAEELTKQENEFMSYFIGKKTTTAVHYTFSVIPESSVNKDLVWFSTDKGISDSSKPGFSAITLSLPIQESVAPNTLPGKSAEKVTNSLYYRTPVISTVTVKAGNTTLSTAKIPVYQAGKLQIIPIM